MSEQNDYAVAIVWQEIESTGKIFQNVNLDFIKAISGKEALGIAVMNLNQTSPQKMVVTYSVRIIDQSKFLTP